MEPPLERALHGRYHLAVNRLQVSSGKREGEGIDGC